MHKIDASWFHPRIKPSETSKITRERIPEQISSQTQYREWKHESERGPVLATKVLNNNERFSLQGVTVFILSRSLSPQSFLLCQCQSLLILKCCVNKIPERRGRKTLDFFLSKIEPTVLTACSRNHFDRWEDREREFWVSWETFWKWSRNRERAWFYQSMALFNIACHPASFATNRWILCLYLANMIKFIAHLSYNSRYCMAWYYWNVLTYL